MRGIDTMRGAGRAAAANKADGRTTGIAGTAIGIADTINPSTGTIAAKDTATTKTAKEIPGSLAVLFCGIALSVHHRFYRS